MKDLLEGRRKRVDRRVVESLLANVCRVEVNSRLAWKDWNNGKEDEGVREEGLFSTSTPRDLKL